MDSLRIDAKKLNMLTKFCKVQDVADHDGRRLEWAQPGAVLLQRLKLGLGFAAYPGRVLSRRLILPSPS